MIIPMKKLSLLLYHKERDSFLKSLQELGVVHIVENPDMTSENLEQMQDAIKTTDRIVKALKKIEKAQSSPVQQIKEGNPEEIISRFKEYESRLEKIEQVISGLEKDVKILTPWGNFEQSSIDRLKDVGINLRFFELSAKKFNELKKDSLYYEIINHKSGIVYFAVVERGDAVTIDADEILPPKISLNKAMEQIKELEAERGTINKSFADLTQYQNVLKSYFLVKTGNRNFEAAQLSMEEAAEGKVLSLTGWLPVKNEKKVTEFLNGFPAWFEMSEPAPDDKIPVLMHNNPFAKLFEPITEIFALPDYFELDPTPFFAPLFAFFFGLCLGDVGYGLIILVISGIAYIKVKDSLKGITLLGMILGGMTILAGIFVNTIFGHSLFAFADTGGGLFAAGGTAALLRQVETARGTYFPAMPFALYLGVVQLILGISMKAYNNFINRGAIYTLQPISNIIMILGILIVMVKINFLDLGILVLGAIPLGPSISAIPLNIAFVICGIGLGMLLLFSSPGKGIGIRLGLGVWAFYQFITGLMADVLSYLRLFALGLASGLLGMAFNQIAFMVITKDGVIQFGSPLIIFTILILVFGHTLNLALNALGSFVHPLRLTFVEFYKNLEFKGGSKPYKPFSNLETTV